MPWPAAVRASSNACTWVAPVRLSKAAASSALIDALDLPRGAAQVGTVEKGSPAEDAGIEPGDVIVAVDGYRVLNHRGLQRALAPRARSASRTRTATTGTRR